MARLQVYIDGILQGFQWVSDKFTDFWTWIGGGLPPPNRKPDLEIIYRVKVSWPGGSTVPPPGQDLTISWRVRNNGNTSAFGEWEDRVYLLDKAVGLVRAAENVPQIRTVWPGESYADQVKLEAPSGVYDVCVAPNWKGDAGPAGETVCRELGEEREEPCVPVQLTPAEGSVVPNGSKNRPVPHIWSFDWQACAGAARYHLYVIPALPGAFPVIGDDTIAGSFYDHHTSGFVDTPNLKGWTWRVRAYVDGQWEPWSDPTTFDVAPLLA